MKSNLTILLLQTTNLCYLIEKYWAYKFYTFFQYTYYIVYSATCYVLEWVFLSVCECHIADRRRSTFLPSLSSKFKSVVKSKEEEPVGSDFGDIMKALIRRNSVKVGPSWKGKFWTSLNILEPLKVMHSRSFLTGTPFLLSLSLALEMSFGWEVASQALLTLAAKNLCPF